jgi:hypothetical protein
MVMLLLRIIIATLASCGLWLVAALTSISGDGILLMQILSFKPFPFTFYSWPFVVGIANCKWRGARIVSRLFTCAFFAFFVCFDTRELCHAIACFTDDCLGTVHRVAGLGLFLILLWISCFLAIQYLIWFPLKISKELKK